MKTLLIALALLATAVLFYFCKQPKYTPGKFSNQHIRWGSGGGFTGKENTYILLDNGQVFKTTGVDGSMSELKKTTRRSAKSLLETVKGLNLAQLNFQHPGNMYSFLEYHEGDQVQRISWGDAQYPVDARVQEVFRQLHELVKN